MRTDDKDPEKLPQSNGDIALKKETEEDEFERLLQEYIDENLENDEDTDVEENENAEEEENNIQVTDIRVTFSPEEEEYYGAYPERAQFRIPASDSYLHAEITVHNPYYHDFKWSRKLKIVLSYSRGTLEEVYKTIVVDSSDILGKLYVNFAPQEAMSNPDIASNTRFFVTIYHDGYELRSKGFQLINLPESYTECFRYNSFDLFRNESGEEIDYSSLLHSQSCFNHNHLGAIVLVQTMENLIEGHDDFIPKFEVRLHDETGRIKVSELIAGNCLESEGKPYFSLTWEMGKDKQTFWSKGMYVVEVLFMDEKMISAPFEVGNKDTESIFARDAVQPKTNIAGKKIVRLNAINDPMQILNEMIGLEDVKKRIGNYRDITLLERKRNELGLPTQTHSLHAAFIGNPGTGKTTVASLFGKILKDLGLLSKGHVVYEERSTLLGQFYSSEHEKTLKAMERAKGGILFIDEAYTLYKPNDPKDPGMNVLETLLTALADTSNNDWMLLLAGYPAEMKGMLNGNPGLESRIPESNRYYFNDYNIDELMQIADLYCRQKCYCLTNDARQSLQLVVKRAHSLRDNNFGNGRYIDNLLSHEVLHNMSHRVNILPNPSKEQLMAIEKEDIPCMQQGNYKKSLAKLHKMIGLKQLKKSIGDHLNFMKLVRMRTDQGIYTELPPMHMIFTGNPGTGKTTVADFIGEIYAALGLLSKGNVIRVERSDLVGIHVGATEAKTKAVLKSAQGNVLFIDEAYSLFGGEKDSNDFGPRVMETLLTTLSREEVDMLVILAGYPQEMERLLSSNPGLKSRFSYTFQFEDYSTDELMEIAQSVAKKGNYSFSTTALKAMKALIMKEMQHKDKHFGNGRFVTRLITTQIIPAMSSRIATLPEDKLRNPKVLQTIEAKDIPISTDEVNTISNNGFNEKSITRSLKKLDTMIGLQQVKTAIHNFVDVSRYLNNQGLSYAGSGGPLKWSFTGNTGVGKSTVAGIMAELLHAMNLLGKGHLVEVKAEELYNVPDYKVDEILKEAMKRSQQGLLFIDGDAPVFKSPQSHFDSEKLRIKLASLTVELPGSYALVIAEYESTRQPLVKSLAQCGITEFDHTFLFEDYTREELLQILEQMLKQRKMKLDTGAKRTMTAYINNLCENRDLGYANARTMKLLSRTIAGITLLRESKKYKEQQAKGVIMREDVKGFVWRDINPRKKVGFK